MDDLEALKQKKLMEMQQQIQGEIQEQAELTQQIQQLEVVVKQKMTREAVERFGNIKAVDQEKAIKVLVVLGQLIQSGKLISINDETLKNILIRLQEKKEFKIKRI